MTPALSISHLRKVYRSGTVAVEDSSLTIPEGEFFGFLGPNGAGKSTTIHCITGVAEPSSGKIETLDQIVGALLALLRAYPKIPAHPIHDLARIGEGIDIEFLRA